MRDKMKIFTKLLFSLFLLALSISFAQSEFDQIAIDYNNGHFTKQESILKQFRYGFDQSRLDEKYKSTYPVKCATHLIKDYLTHKESFSAEQRAEIESYINGSSPDDINMATFISPSGIFEVTYSTTGSNSIPATDLDNSGVPDYAEEIAEYFDWSWAHMIDTLGFIAPRLQNNVYRISFESMGSYGYTTTTGNTTRIVMNTSYAGFPPNTDPEGNEIGAAKVTAYHEFKHAVQFAYNNWGNETSRWFMEADATWSEDIGYDNVNDYYNYLSASQLRDPGRALTDSDGYEDCIFLHYFTEKLGNQFNVDLWVSIRENNFADVFAHMDHVLQNNYSSSLADELPGYYTWNAFTGGNNIESVPTYEEAKDYPTSRLCQSTDEFPKLINGCQISESGSNIIRIISPKTDDFFSFEITTTNENFIVPVIVDQINDDPIITYHNVDTDGNVFRLNSQMSSIEQIYLVPLVNSFASDNYNYTLDIKTFRYAEFNHTPVADRESDEGIIISTFVETPFNIAIIDSLKLNYTTDGNSYSRIEMSPTSNPGEYEALVPPTGLDKTINYFFSIVDTANNLILYPENAPQETFSFFIGADGVAPVVSLYPAQTELSTYNFPYQLAINATDNLGVDSVIVEYNVNGSDFSDVANFVKDSLYLGYVDFDNDLSAGDEVNYRIRVVDNSSNKNTVVYPATGFETISIIEGFVFESEPNKFVKDNTFPSVKDTIFIEDNLIISDLDLYIEGTHDRFSDWEIKLRTPAGQTNTIVSRPGLDTDFEAAANPQVLFDQSANFSVEDIFFEDNSNAVGVFQPVETNLDIFNTADAAGNWVLFVSDEADGFEGTVDYWSLIIRGEIVTSVDDPSADGLPTEYNLAQNYPNPFNPSTIISYSLPQNSNVTIKLFDILGNEVAVLVDEAKAAGRYELNFDASNLTSGIYFYQIKTNNFFDTKKMLLVK
jgi:subtilisin-like proprotein convertase family protein